MGKLTKLQARAIAHYMEQHNVIAQLSAFPTVTFKHKHTGEISERQLPNLVSQYETDYKEQLKEAARQRKADKKVRESETR